jgi:hypothetical protein
MNAFEIVGDATADEVAAISAVLTLHLSADAMEAMSGLPPSAWQVAAAVEAQELPPSRAARHRTWASAERARREGRWSNGILGL